MVCMHKHMCAVEHNWQVPILILSERKAVSIVWSVLWQNGLSTARLGNDIPKV